jgi:hypothetical protein
MPGGGNMIDSAVINSNGAKHHTQLNMVWLMDLDGKDIYNRRGSGWILGFFDFPKVKILKQIKI